jgi:hypothetical protein
VSASSSSIITPTALVFANLPDQHLVALAQLLGQEPVYLRQRVSKLNFSWATLNELKVIITYVNDHMRGYSSKRLRKAGIFAAVLVSSLTPQPACRQQAGPDCRFVEPVVQRHWLRVSANTACARTH